MTDQFCYAVIIPMHLWMHSYWDQQFREELGFWLALMFLEKSY